MKNRTLIFNPICDLGARNDPSFETCPETHPYAYFNGQFCCKTSPSCGKEDRIHLTNKISFCENRNFIECPGSKCSSISGEICIQTIVYGQVEKFLKYFELDKSNYDNYETFYYSERRSLSDGILKVDHDNHVQLIQKTGDEKIIQLSREQIMSRRNVTSGHNGERKL